MFHVWGFDRVGVVAGDLFFIDPEQSPGEEGAEHGVRVEVRLLDKPPLGGSVYSSQQIVIGQPVWRGDLLETVKGHVGSFNRAHDHPHFEGWEPDDRRYDTDIKTDPAAWLAGRLSDLPGLLAGAGIDPERVGPSDGAQLAAAASAISVAAVDLLEQVRNGELGTPPVDLSEDEMLAGIRSGWL
jgi:hypothetical protein